MRTCISCWREGSCAHDEADAQGKGEVMRKLWKHDVEDRLAFKKDQAKNGTLHVCVCLWEILLFDFVHVQCRAIRETIVVLPSDSDSSSSDVLYSSPTSLISVDVILQLGSCETDSAWGSSVWGCVFSVPVQLLVTVTSSVSCNIVAIAVEVDVAWAWRWVDLFGSV